MTGWIPRRDRTPVQQAVAAKVDAALENLFMALERLPDAGAATIEAALALESVDLADAWSNYAEEAAS